MLLKTRSRINKTDVFYGDDGEKIEAVTEIQVHRPASLWVNEAKIAQIGTKSSPIDGGCNGKTIYTWGFFPLPRSVEHLLWPSQRFRRNGWSTWTKWPWTVLRRWRWSPLLSDGSMEITSSRGQRRGIPWEVSINATFICESSSTLFPIACLGFLGIHPDLTVCSARGPGSETQQNLWVEPSHAQPKGGRYGAPGQLPGNAWPMSLWGYTATCGLLVQEPDAQSMLNPCSVHLAGCWHVTCWSEKIWHENRLVQDFVHCVDISQSFCDFEKPPGDGSFLEVRTTPKLQPKHVPCRGICSWQKSPNAAQVAACQWEAGRHNNAGQSCKASCSCCCCYAGHGGKHPRLQESSLPPKGILSLVGGRFYFTF